MTTTSTSTSETTQTQPAREERATPHPQNGGPRQDLKQLEDESLARLAIQGDTTAWRILYRRTYVHLFDLALQLTDGEDQAEDLVQEALIRAWERRETYDLDRSWRTWIRTILKNLSASMHRHRKSYQNKLDEVERRQGGEGLWHGRPLHRDVRQELDHLEAHELLEEILNQLTDKEREVLVAWARGARIVDLADKWKENPSTLRGRLWRARKRLRELFEQRVPREVQQDLKDEQ